MDPFTVQLIIFAVSALLTILLAPKPPKAKPNVMDSKSFPLAEEGSPIPVVIGKYIVEQPNMVWYGDLDTEAVETKSGK